MKKKTFLNKEVPTLTGLAIIVAWTIITIGGALVYQYSTEIDVQAEYTTDKMTRFRFEDYAVKKREVSQIAEIDFSGVKDAGIFRKKIEESLGREINFAGHYILGLWSCGGNCQMGKVLDALTGELYDLPGIISCGLAYRADSKLLIVDIDKRCNRRLDLSTRYFVWENS